MSGTINSDCTDRTALTMAKSTDDSHGRQVIHESTVPVDWRGDRIPLVQLREMFRDLMDKSTESVINAGLDFDDTVIVRSLQCSVGSSERYVLLEPPLSDRQRLEEKLLEMVGSIGGGETTLSSIVVTGITIRVLKDSHGQFGVEP